MSKYSTKDFINKSKSIHGDKFDYSITNYVNSKTKVKLICKKHGIFEQNPVDHYFGYGCPKCARKTKTTLDFINKAIEIHNDKFDYSQVEYINSTVKVKIICKTHGVFEQWPVHHLKGSGCPTCLNKFNVSDKTQVFIDHSNKIHNYFYDYSLVKYIKGNSKVKIICPIHGVFEQLANNHIGGSGCYRCSKENIYKTIGKKIEDFKNESNLIHNNKYNYDLVEYKNVGCKVKIICPIHGIFKQTAASHYKGTGCPKCQMSKGEQKIENWLKDQNIYYITQKKFNNLKYIKQLKFDFYLPDYNTCIEYDGEQHYKLISRRKNESYEDLLLDFWNSKEKDEIKTKYCQDNNINLLRIPYWEFSTINLILNQKILQENLFLVKPDD